MTERQKRFADYYLETGNARKSAIKAGYSPGYAEHVKRQRGVREYLRRRIAELGGIRVATADEILEFLTDVMRGNTVDKRGISLQVKAAEMISRRMGYTVENKEDDG